MAQSKKPDDTAYRDLRKDLSDGKVGNLYVFCGEESYLRDHYLGKLKETLLTGGLDDFNYHVLSGKDFSLSRLHELVDAMPMMSERTMVVVMDYDMDKGDREGLMELLSDLPEYVCLVFVYDVIDYKPDNRTKLPKLVREKGRVVNFARQQQGELTGWIARHFRSHGHDISTEDARYLIFLCGDLMTGLNSEIEKISAYAKGQRVTRQDIDAVATPLLDAIVFQLTDAIGERDFDKAFSVLGDLLHMQEPPVKLLAGVGRQMRQLYTARLGLDRGKDARWLMTLWGMSSAYPAEKLMRVGRRFSLNWCRNAVQSCEKADLKMKSLRGADGGEVLTELLLELSQRRAS